MHVKPGLLSLPAEGKAVPPTEGWGFALAHRAVLSHQAALHSWQSWCLTAVLHTVNVASLLLTAFRAAAPGAGQILDKSFKGNRLEHVTKPSCGPGLELRSVLAWYLALLFCTLVCAHSVLVPLSRALTAAASVQADEPRPVCSACNGYPKTWERAVFPSTGFKLPCWDWVSPSAELDVCLCCCVHRIHFAVFQGKLLFEVDFLKFFLWVGRN